MKYELVVASLTNALVMFRSYLSRYLQSTEHKWALYNQVNIEGPFSFAALQKSDLR